MTIYFKDFQGRFLNDTGCMSEPDIEPISGAVELANSWISENPVKVINVETFLTIEFSINHDNQFSSHALFPS